MLKSSVRKLLVARLPASGMIFGHDTFMEIKLKLFLLLYRACCRVTQLLHQPLHIYQIYKIYTLKH